MKMLTLNILVKDSEVDKFLNTIPAPDYENDVENVCVMDSNVFAPRNEDLMDYVTILRENLVDQEQIDTILAENNRKLLECPVCARESVVTRGIFVPHMRCGHIIYNID